jgi:hypothetical protein
VLLLALGLAGCSSQAKEAAPAHTPEPAAPAPQGAPEATTESKADAEPNIVAALDELARAERTVGEALGGGAPAADAPSRKDASKPAKPKGGAPGGAEQLGTSTCSLACQALTSMKRSAGHLCELAGADDARCTESKKRVATAEERVHARCPLCSE